MEKVNLGPQAFIPMPVFLLGATVEGKPNFMTVGWISRVNYVPPMIAVSVNKEHYTPLGINSHASFSVNLPGADLVAKTDYCGIVSGRNADKSKLFDLFYGALESAPMIKECPVCLECKLVDVIPLPTNDLYIGEIVGAYSEDRYLTDGKPDIKKMNPLFLTMPDNRYWKLGDFAEMAWCVGRTLKEEGK
jgi:flavin reductase (DIM6/NTAB) family NADH-FMN oxidoreductase RutF